VYEDFHYIEDGKGKYFIKTYNTMGTPVWLFNRGTF